MTRPILLQVEGITKAYPGVVANSDVSFAIREGGRTVGAGVVAKILA